MKTLTEFIAKKHQSQSNRYKYHPETKIELIENIETELDAGNCDLNCIDTSKITDMSNLFSSHNNNVQLTEQQQKKLDVSKWNVSNVENMSFMFVGCTDFNLDLSCWDTSKVKNMDSMFAYCHKFDQDLSQWDVSKVKNMDSMFWRCISFNKDLSRWDTSNVKNMNGMFYDCTSLKNRPAWYK